ncbi:hypothetical protein P5G70_02600 [Serratia nevei]|nr:hypothetical protein [Serratia nevei]
MIAFAMRTSQITGTVVDGVEPALPFLLSCNCLVRFSNVNHERIFPWARLKRNFASDAINQQRDDGDRQQAPEQHGAGMALTCA